MSKGSAEQPEDTDRPGSGRIEGIRRGSGNGNTCPLHIGQNQWLPLGEGERLPLVLRRMGELACLLKHVGEQVGGEGLIVHDEQRGWPSASWLDYKWLLLLAIVPTARPRGDGDRNITLANHSSIRTPLIHIGLPRFSVRSDFFSVDFFTPCPFVHGWPAVPLMEDIPDEVGIFGLREGKAVSDAAVRDGGPHDPTFHFQRPVSRLQDHEEDTAHDHLDRKLHHQPADADVADHPRELCPPKLSRPADDRHRNRHARKAPLHGLAVFLHLA